MERIEAIHKASVSRPFAAAVVVMAAYDLSGAKAADLGKWLTSHWVVVLGNARYLLEAFDFLYLLPLLPRTRSVRGRINGCRDDRIGSSRTCLQLMVFLIVHRTFANLALSPDGLCRPW
jgi:hypothetical protein